MWWAILRTTADLIETQDRLNNSQVALLRSKFFDGMGSFSDFSLDTKRWEAKAVEANNRLNKIRSELFAFFEQQ